MRKYIIHYGYGNTLTSSSRDAKKHARNLGQSVRIYTLRGKLVSAAMLDCMGKAHTIYNLLED